MELIQPFKKRIMEQSMIRLSQPIVLNSVLLDQRQPTQVHLSQQSFQLQQQCLEQPQKIHLQTPPPNQLQQPLPHVIQIIKYQPYESPMTLNAWTQTKPDDFPKSLQLVNNEAALEAKISELEENFTSQAAIIRALEQKQTQSQSPNRDVSNSVPSLHSDCKTYRILNQSNGLKNGTQIELKISEDIKTKSACSVNTSPRSDLKEDFMEPISDCSFVSIGPNDTKIPKEQYDKILWTSVSGATRRLLSLIFDRKTLATHSMTGKASPAFKDLKKPVKGKLDPKAIQDIIYIVSRKCKASEKEVRNSITTKCADENKMLRLKAMKTFDIKPTEMRALKDFNK